MWDYDKLFEENGVVSLKNTYLNKVYIRSIIPKMYWDEDGSVD